MSELKVNKISPKTACGTTTLGDSGDTFTIPAGVTITNNGTQTGFGRTGAVDWQTGSIKTAASFTAADGEGYFIDTTSNAITANLPAGSAGAIVAFADYARNFNNNGFTISPNGSEKIGGVAQDLVLDVKGQALTLVYVDSTNGWINVQNAEDTETGTPPFIQATGGTITCSGNCRVHTFTGPGTFQVTSLSPTPANNVLSYLVVAGGGGADGGSASSQSGGGAGGFREYKSPVTPYTASPLDGNPCGTAITATVASFPITIGAGGGGLQTCGGTPTNQAGGSNSVFSTITSAGGGSGNPGGVPTAGNPGGSGGGGSGNNPPAAAGSGNTPPVTPPQGNDGGNAVPALVSGQRAGGGGGGAGGAGGQGQSPRVAGAGGVGVPTSITGSAVSYAGGGGASNQGPGGSGGGASPCGTGGVGRLEGASPTTGGSGTANRGGGGGAGASGGPGGSGGSGIVVIRYKKA
jgi:hypothetical protein